MKTRVLKHFSVLWLFGQSALGLAAQLPSSLDASEIQRSVSLLGFGAVNRSLLSAESLGIEPGIRVGMVQSMIVTHDLQKLGNKDGNVPEVVPLPSFYLAKGFPLGIDAQVSLAPPKVLNYVESYGGSVGWTFFSERDLPVALGVRGHFSYSELFSGDLKTWTWGANVAVSKDYVTWEPYAHIGLAMADGCVRDSSAAEGANSCQGQIAGVGAVGVKLNMALTFVAQIETHNLDPVVSLFIGKDF